MKTCTNCGASNNDNVSFCTTCGANIQNQNPVFQQPIVQPSVQPVKDPISVGGWIGRSLIPMIPVIGSIVYLIMLFIWSGDTSKEDTFRNWAKAQLIVTLIVVILLVLFFILFGSAIAASLK